MVPITLNCQKNLITSKKDLTNVQSDDDNKCFKWSNALHAADENSARMRKCDKYFWTINLDFKDIKLPVRFRDIHKIEKTNSISISVFRYENSRKFPVYLSKNTFKRHVYLLLIEEGGQSHNALSNNLAHSC